MAAVAGPLHPVRAMQEDHVMDTRTPSPVQRTVSKESENDTQEGDYKPDLSAEVAMLSTKLVNAINYNTNLDDTLQASRHELEHYRRKCATLEVETQRLQNMIETGELLKKADVDKTVAQLRSELASERAAREAAEKSKKQTEGELENLTSALFEEANSMVAIARKDTEAVEKRNAQLKGQLEDTETILLSQQEQLQDLKATMEKLQEPQIGRSPSMPSTPITANHAVFDALQLSPNSANLADVPPEHPLHFTQLIAPVLRNDTTAFGDFQDLLLLARRLGAHSRNPSSTGGQASSSLSTYANVAATSSSPNLPGAFSFSNSSSPVSNYGGSAGSLPPLKESKFYKRVLSEDIEPTLRLDLAPGLSFLSRRTVLGSLLAGTLAVEPYPQNKHYFACTLCGESRRKDRYIRKYRFRTSEDDNVSKPLCDYCVSRLRATCDFVGFLRMVRDGHWKCENEEDQKSAWEESVRLRERMFWSRLGGGVVPCFQLSSKSTDPPSGATDKTRRLSLESIPEGEAKATDEYAASEGKTYTDSDVFTEKSKPADVEVAKTSRDVTALTTPEMHPAQVTEAGVPTPPPTTSLDPNEDAYVTSAQSTTPFEDAVQQLHGASNPDEQLKKELEAEALPASAAEGDETATHASEAADTATTHSSAVQSREATPRSSLHAEHPPHSRKNSSVLERVRALQAASGQP